MKTRNDFVSNSSSCSFIVKINSQEDKDILSDILKKYNPYIWWIIDPNRSYESTLVKSTEDLETNSFYLISLGDDTLETIEEFENLQCDIENYDTTHNHKFEVYSDCQAHCTFGKEYEDKN